MTPRVMVSEPAASVVPTHASHLEHQQTAQMQGNTSKLVAMLKTGLPVMQYCQLFSRQDLQRGLADRRRKAQADVALYTETWSPKAGVRDVEVDVRVPDWSYQFRDDHKVFVYPTEYAKPVVVTTWANFVECVKNAAGPNVVDADSGERSFYDLNYERAIGEADLSCVTRENLKAYGKETEDFYDDFCVWLEAAALAQYGSNVVSVCDRAPDSVFDPAARQTLIGQNAQSQQYVYKAPCR